MNNQVISHGITTINTATAGHSMEDNLSMVPLREPTTFGMSNWAKVQQLGMEQFNNRLKLATPMASICCCTPTNNDTNPVPKALVGESSVRIFFFNLPPDLFS